MNDKIDENELSFDEILKQNEKLKKDNDKIKKRLDRVVQQGDRQHKQFEKLNEKFESYIEVIDDNIISINTDKDKKITSVSIAFSNTFGFKIEDIDDKNLDFLLCKDDLEKIDIELQDAVSTKESWHGEVRFISKSNQIVWTETIITPNFDDEKFNGFTFITKDISKEKELKDLKSQKIANQKYDQSMLEFMSSRSSALLQRTSNSFSYVLWIIFATVIWTIVWANYADLEELTRGTGTIIPANHVKKIDSFDNARVEKIYVSKGDIVKKGQILLKFNSIEKSSTLEQNTLRLEELRAKSKRLELESNLIIRYDLSELNPNKSYIMKEELSLYKTNIKQLKLKISAMKEKIKQKKSELDEALKKETHLKNNFTLLEKELVIKEKMAKVKIISEVEFLQFQRQKNDLEQELNQMTNEILRAKSSIEELSQNINEVKLEFKNRAKKEYHEVLSEIARLLQMHNSLNDQFTRSEIFSPVSGTIKKINVNTIGEVVQGGNTLFEIVPLNDALIAEVKIAPEDIAYLKVDQDALMKFTSYDFNIYGGIKAKISYISADTILDPEDGKYYYMINLNLEKEYLGNDENKLPIKIGMVADVDIIHGKKSVMDYILKPILKAKQNALTEK